MRPLPFLHEISGMEIALPVRSNRTIMMATTAVFVLGLALSFSTWHNLRQQQESFREHALVTARSIAAGIEFNLQRELHLPPRTKRERADSLPFRPLARDLLHSYIERTDARFIALYDPHGHILLSSHADPKTIQEQLPTIAWERMDTSWEWSGDMNFEGQSLLVLGRLSRLGMDGLCTAHECPREGKPPMLLVGMDLSSHLRTFEKYRRTAILQTGYILAVTIVFWLLLLGFLQRKEQSQRLQRLESFNVRLLDTMPDGLLTLSAGGTVMSANPAAQKLLNESALIGRPLPKSLFPDQGLDRRNEQEWTTHTTDGKDMEILQRPLKDGSGQNLILIRDRTEMAGLERELHRNEKLAAIGRMAAGLAHEIRNPLSALRGFAQFFAKKLAGQEPEELYARTMLQEADRLNRVITDLLFLARPRQLTFSRITVADIFAEVSTLLSMDMEAKKARLAMHPDAPLVVADQDALKQALINLLMNSLAALPETGGNIELHSALAPDGVWIRVRDNGRGMNAEERERALEPFFSTRDKGTGLGLAIVHTIMQEHGGSIELDSSPGNGTTVSLFFPENTKPLET